MHWLLPLVSGMLCILLITLRECQGEGLIKREFCHSVVISLMHARVLVNGLEIILRVEIIMQAKTHTIQ